MKNILKYTATALLAASMFTACTGAFDDLNTDPKGVSDEELKQDNNYIGMHFIPMMQSIYYNNGGGSTSRGYQMIPNLETGMLCVFVRSGNCFAAYVKNHIFSLKPGLEC